MSKEYMFTSKAKKVMRKERKEGEERLELRKDGNERKFKEGKVTIDVKVKKRESKV